MSGSNLRGWQAPAVRAASLTWTFRCSDLTSTSAICVMDKVVGHMKLPLPLLVDVLLIALSENTRSGFCTLNMLSRAHHTGLLCPLPEHNIHDSFFQVASCATAAAAAATLRDVLFCTAYELCSIRRQAHRCMQARDVGRCSSTPIEQCHGGFLPPAGIHPDNPDTPLMPAVPSGGVQQPVGGRDDGAGGGRHRPRGPYSSSQTPAARLPGSSVIISHFPKWTQSKGRCQSLGIGC